MTIATISFHNQLLQHEAQLHLVRPPTAAYCLLLSLAEICDCAGWIQYQAIQLLYRIIQMRRQISQAQRDSLRKLIMTSNDSKQLSKHKKPKNAPTHPIQPIQPRTETLHNPQPQTQHCVPQLTHSRIVQKLAMIEKLTEKYLDKQQKKCYSELIQLMVKEEQLRTLIDSSQKQNNKQKVKEQRDHLLHILQKQENLVNSSSQPLNPVTINLVTTGVFVKEAIARQTSPKMKLQSYGFSDLSKKNGDNRQKHFLAQLNKKDLIIKRLFQKIENLQQNTTHQKKPTFKENIDGINHKLQQNHQKIRQLEHLSSKQAKEYKDLSHNYRIQIQAHKADYNRLFQDYNQLHTKYIQLEQEFKSEMLQKEEWERKFNKLAKQKKAKQQKSNGLLVELKTKVQQLLKYDIIQMKNMHKIVQNKVKEELQLMKEATNAEICNLSMVIDIQKQQQKAKLSWQVNQCQKLQNLLESYQQTLLQLKLQNQQLSNKLCFSYQYKQPQLFLQSKVFALDMTPKQRRLSFINFPIYLGQLKIQRSLCIYKQKYCNPKLVIQNEISQRIQNQKQTKQIEVQTFFEEKGIQNNKERIQSSSQTEHQPNPHYLSTKLQTVQKHLKQSETQTKQRSTISVCISTKDNNLQIQQVFQYDFHFQITTNNKSYSQILSISKELELQLSTKGTFQNIEIQTQSHEEQLIDQEFEDFKIIEDCDLNKSCHPSDIWKLLEEAQQCTIVPEIAILKQQLATYRDEIQRLKNVVRQHEKQKQEENVFNFRL